MLFNASMSLRARSLETGVWPGGSGGGSATLRVGSARFLSFRAGARDMKEGSDGGREKRTLNVSEVIYVLLERQT